MLLPGGACARKCRNPAASSVLDPPFHCFLGSVCVHFGTNPSFFCTQCMPLWLVTQGHSFLGTCFVVSLLLSFGYNVAVGCFDAFSPIPCILQATWTQGSAGATDRCEATDCCETHQNICRQSLHLLAWNRRVCFLMCATNLVREGKTTPW